MAIPTRSPWVALDHGREGCFRVPLSGRPAGTADGTGFGQPRARGKDPAGWTSPVSREEGAPLCCSVTPARWRKGM